MACGGRFVRVLGSLGRSGTFSGAPGLACSTGRLYVPCGAGVALFEYRCAGYWRQKVIVCLPSEVLWCKVETETGLVLAGCAGGLVYHLPTSELECCGLIEKSKIGSHDKQRHVLEDAEALSVLPIHGQRIVTLRRLQGHWQIGCYILKEDKVRLGKGDGGHRKPCLRYTEISPTNLLPWKSADIIHREKSRQPLHRGHWTEDLLPPLMVLLSSVDCTLHKNLDQTRNSVCSSLFRLLFGDVDSPIVVCGLPDGRVVSAPNAGSGSRKPPPLSQTPSPRDKNPLVLHDLKQPLVAIGTARLPCGKKFGKEGAEQPNCLVVVGTRGKVVVLTVGVHDDRESLIVREFCVQGPITCAQCVRDCLYYSTLRGLHCAQLSISRTTGQDGDDGTEGRPSHEEVPHTPAESLSPMLHPHNLGIGSCSSMITCDIPEGSVELVMLNRVGHLCVTSTCSQDGEGNAALQKTPSPGPVCSIQDLIGAIENVSARASSLKSYQQQQDSTLKQLNWVLELVSWLGSHQFELPATSSSPLSCSLSVRWTQNLHRDVLSVRCVVRNGTDCTLSESWILRVSIRGAFLRFGLPEGHPSTITHTFSMAALPPRRELELTLPLWGDAGCFDLLQPLELTSFLQYGSPLVLRHDSPSNPITIPLNLVLIDALNCLRTDNGAQWGKADTNVNESFGKSLCGVPVDDIEEGLGTGTKSPLVFVQRFSEEAVQRMLQIPGKVGIQGRQLCTAFLAHLLANCPGLLPPTCAVLDCLGPDGRPVRLAVTQEYIDVVSTLEVRVTCLSMALMCALRLALARRAKMIMDECDGRKPQVTASKEKFQEALCNMEGILEEVRSTLGKRTSSGGRGATMEGSTEELLNLYLKTRTQSLCI
uniref:Fanconi anemia core complex-associated protein 100 isoform X2 n=1 Tax=Myxine glutinosa TaxID=7769 RepID=UPI00358DEE2B